MDNLSLLLNYTRIDPIEILHSPCIITLKIDGNAFQIAYNKETDKITYHKRPWAANKLGQEINDFDLMCYPCYYNAIKIFKDDNKDIIKNNFSIINFEIIDNSMNHLIKYKKENIYALSSYNLNSALNSNDLSLLVHKYKEIKNVPILFSGVFSYDFIDILLYNKNNMNCVWEIFKQELQLKNVDDIEGIVFEFDAPDKVRRYKLVNPKFKKELDIHLNKEKLDKEDINLEHIYDFIVNFAKFNYSELTLYKNKYNNYLATLLCLYHMITHSAFSNSALIKYENELKSLNLSPFDTILFNKEFLSENFSNIYEFFDEQYINILKFIILCFRNKRKTNCVWCSKEYQESKINPFIDSLMNNV